MEKEEEEEEEEENANSVVDSSEWVDLLGSKAVMKKSLREPPSPKMCPEYKQLVVVHLIGKDSASGRVFHNTRDTNTPISCYVGDQIMDWLPPGLMLAVRSMGVGELAQVKMESRYAYAADGHWFGLAPNSDVEFEIELLSMGEMQTEVAEQTPAQLRATMRAFRERGNTFFNWGEMDKAVRCYKEGVRYGDGLFANGEDVDKEVYAERVACISNVATVLERQGKNREAMESTILALQADPSHLKSLTRATRLAIASGNHEEAAAAIKVALNLTPTNAVVLKLKANLEARVAEYAAKEKQRYGGFLKPVDPIQAELARNLPPSSSSPPHPSPATPISGIMEEFEEFTPAEASGALSEKVQGEEALGAYLKRLLMLFLPSVITLLAVLVWQLRLMLL